MRTFRAEPFLVLGAVSWMLGGIGHLVMIDLLSIHAPASVFAISPHPDLYRTMSEASMTWRGWPVGTTDVFSAFSGFSFWVTASTVAIGALNLVFVAEGNLPPRLRRRVVIVNVVAAGAFTAIAAAYLITAPAVGGVIGTAVYLAAWWRAPRRTAAQLGGPAS